ncbi:MAG: hypothetical protein ACRYFA_09805 [Janthinobacterium lividum]
MLLLSAKKWRTKLRYICVDKSLIKMDVNDKSTLVQMRLQPDTLERIEKLSKLTQMDNRAQLISSAIRLTDDMINLVKNGAKLYIEKPDGTKELLKITGI